MKMAIIAISRYYETNDNKKIFLKNYYTECLTKLGVLLIPILPENNMEQIVDYCDTLLIIGIEKGNMIGVQWHPEIMKDLNFFEKFINGYINKNMK